MWSFVFGFFILFWGLGRMYVYIVAVIGSQVSVLVVHCSMSLPWWDDENNAWAYWVVLVRLYFINNPLENDGYVPGSINLIFNCQLYSIVKFLALVGISMKIRTIKWGNNNLFHQVNFNLFNPPLWRSGTPALPLYAKSCKMFSTILHLQCFFTLLFIFNKWKIAL